MNGIFVRVRYISAVLCVVALGVSAPVYLGAQRGGNAGGNGLNDRIESLEAAVAQLTAALAAETAAREAAEAALQDSIEELSGGNIPQVLTDLANYVTVIPSTVSLARTSSLRAPTSTYGMAKVAHTSAAPAWAT